MSIILALVAAASGSTSPPAVPLTCPEYVVTKQELVTPAAGWHISQDRTMSVGGKLRGKVTGFSAGPPERMAILAPDSTTPSRKDKNILVNTWPLERSEQVWVICSYAQTTIQLSRQLPAHLKKCFIQFSLSNGPVRAWCE